MSVGDEWRNGWPVVLAASAGMMMIAVMPYSFGVFVAPLHEAFGWDRAQLALALSISGVLNVVGGPVIGYAADRIGVRRIALFGTSIECLAIAALSQVQPNIASYWAHYAFVAVGAMLCSPLIWTRAVVTRFRDSRGTALAFTAFGSTVSGIAAPLVATFLIAHWGWQNAFIALAAFLFVFTFPLVLAFLYDAQDLARRGLVDAGPPGEKPLETQSQAGPTVREAVRTRAFWLVAVSGFTSAFAGVSVLIHLIPLLKDRGLAPMQAAAGLSVVSVVAVVGRLGGGYMLDRISAAAVAAISFSLAVVGCLLLLLAPVTVVISFVASGLLGLAVGVELSLLPYITARCFGLRSYGAIYALILAAFMIGSSAGPPIVGLLYEWQKNYDGGLIIMAVSFFLSGAVLQILKVPQARTLAVAGSMAS
jgi:MFS family permease